MYLRFVTSFSSLKEEYLVFEMGKIIFFFNLSCSNQDIGHKFFQDEL